MKKAVIFGILLLVMNSLLPVNAFGQETVVYGPQTFICEKGKPHFIEDSFFVDEVTGTFTLKIQNGVSGDRQSRVNAAKILLNDVKIAGRKDINKRVESTDILIEPIQGENSIKVKVRGKTDSFIIVSVIFSPATECTIYGPQTFVRKKGKPRFVEDSFFVDDIASTFTLKIQNGMSGNKHSRVSAAKILLNDVKVAGHKNINKKVESTEISISPVQGENSIKVKVKGRPCSFIIVSIVSSLGIERIIKPPLADPDGIFVSESTLVTVTAEIAPDPDLISSEVSLLRLDEHNQLIDILGYLHDDGLNGDVLADDNIFTLQTTFLESEPTEIRLQVSAAYTTPYSPALSGIFTVDAVEPISEEDFQIILDIEAAAAQYFEDLKQTYSDDEARQMTADWLKTQAGVQDAGISIDNDTIWILFESGLEGGIITHPLGTRGSPSGDSTDHVVTPGVSKAIVLAPFFDEFSISGGDESDYIAQKISQIWVPTSTIKNAAVTVNLMKPLSQHGVVSITSHGSISRNNEVQIFTREKPTLFNRLAYIFDLMTGRIAIESGYYVIRPKFITHYARRHPYKKSLVYVGACYSKGNHTMANAFLNSGAYTYFGYDDAVNSDFAFNIGTELFEHLVDDQMTTGDAFNALPNKIDPTPPHAEFLINGGADLVLLPVPIIESIYPADGATITELLPEIKAKVYRPGYEIDPDVPDIDLESIALTLTDYQGIEIPGTLTFDPGQDAPAITVTFISSSDLQVDDPATPDINEGKHTVTIDAKDIDGVAADQRVWTFFVGETEKNWLWVVDCENYRIQGFTKEGVFVGKFGSQGDGDGEFQWLRGITTDAEYVYVASDKLNDPGKIQKFTLDGNFVLKFDTSNAQAWDPYGIVVSEGCLYASTSPFGSHIIKYNLEGEIQAVYPGGQFETLAATSDHIYGVLISTIYKYDKSGNLIAIHDITEDGASDCAYHVTTDGKHLWITDLNKVYKYSLDLEYISNFTVPDAVEGLSGITTDGTYLWIADFDMHRVSRCKLDGSEFEHFGSYGNGDGEFNEPTGIATVRPGM